MIAETIYNRARLAAWHGLKRDDSSETRYDVVNRLKNKPCMDCHGSFPAIAMDFDHRPGEKKIGNISKLIKCHSIEVLILEISKCDLVCSNCHRIRTWKRANGGMTEMALSHGV